MASGSRRVPGSSLAPGHGISTHAASSAVIGIDGISSVEDYRDASDGDPGFDTSEALARAGAAYSMTSSLLRTAVSAWNPRGGRESRDQAHGAVDRLNEDQQGLNQEDVPLPLLQTLSAPQRVTTRFEDLIGQDAAVQILQDLVRRPVSSAPRGVLLYGPPGTGKTLAAKACAAAMGARFINVPITAVLTATVGDAERALSAIFRAAAAASPCVVFFDEVQALFVSRASLRGASEQVARMSAALTSQFCLCLDELQPAAPSVGGSGDADATPPVEWLPSSDGVEAAAYRTCAALTPPRSTPRSRSVLVLAATNVPEAIDPALLRPGRLEHCVLVDLPSPEARAQHFSRVLTRLGLAPSSPAVDSASPVPSGLVHTCVSRSDGFSGADIDEVGRIAYMAALERRALAAAASLLPSASFSSSPSTAAPSSPPLSRIHTCVLDAPMHAVLAALTPTGDGAREVLVTEDDVLAALTRVRPSTTPGRVEALRSWRPGR